MKNLLRTSLLLVVTLLLASFSESEEKEFIGTFGVCDSENGMVKLELKEDHKFHYFDYSDPSNSINIIGTWSLQGAKVVLDAPDDIDFHNKWKISKDGKVAKSRKGMCFYRLVKR